MMHSSFSLVIVAASNNLFQVPLKPGFLASPVSQVQEIQGSFAEPAFVAPPAMQPTHAPGADFFAPACAVAMFAIIGYSIGRKSAQPLKNFTRGEAGSSTALQLAGTPAVHDHKM